MPVVSRDPGRVGRLEALKSDEGAPQEVFELLCEGVGLKTIAERWNLPRGAFARWFATEHEEVFEAALRVRAEVLANEALERADAATPETVSVAKLQAELRVRLAGKWDPDRYGDRVRVERGETPLADAGLVVAAASLLERIRDSVREEKIVGDALESRELPQAP